MNRRTSLDEPTIPVTRCRGRGAPAGVLAVAALVALLLAVGLTDLFAEDHGAAAFECVPCGMRFSDTKEWARHEIKAHGARGCARCGVLLANDLEEAAHRILHHGATHCLACGRDFSTNREAVDHLVSTHHLPHCSIHHMVFANDEEAAAHAASCPVFRAVFEKEKAWRAEKARRAAKR